jgi:hypothetical protein
MPCRFELASPNFNGAGNNFFATKSVIVDAGNVVISLTAGRRNNQSVASGLISGTLSAISLLQKKAARFPLAAVDKI